MAPYTHNLMLRDEGEGDWFLSLVEEDLLMLYLLNCSALGGER